jgi:cytochrome P450
VSDRRRRWAASHGVVRGTVRRRARAGVADAVLADEETGADERRVAWAELRAHRPFAEGALPGTLVTVHHDVAREVLASRAFAMPPPPSGTDGPPGPQHRPSLIALDGDDHVRHRARLSRAFTPRALTAWSDEAARIADDLLDDLPGTAGDGGVVDLVAGYAHPLPLRLITAFLGLTRPLPAGLPRWSDSVVAALDTGMSFERFAAIEDDLSALQTWLRGELGHASGLLGRLADENPDDDPDDLVVTAMFLLAAGFETTTHLISTGAVALAAHPEQAALLAAEPGRWPDAVDELLRLEGPVTRAARRAVCDVEVAGTTVPAGTLVLVHVGATGHDPAVFPDPSRFDVGRPNVRAHLAFSHGPHHCLGAGLARMEAATGLAVLFRRFPRLTPVGAGERRPTTLVSGRATLPVHLGTPA